MGELGGKLLGACVLLAGAAILQVLLRRTGILRSVAVSLNALVVLAIAAIFLREYTTTIHNSGPVAVDAFLAFAAVTVALRLMETLVFDLLLARRADTPPVPVLLRDVSRWILLGVAAFVILRTAFPGLNLSALAVSSLVVGYIVGNATQDTLGNLIAGIALSTEKPFSIGDWVLAGGHTGRVEEMTWRSTRLVTKMLDHILIPNALIAREVIVNYSRPTRAHGCTVTIGAAYDAPPNKVRRVVFEVLQSVPEVLTTPRPEVYLHGYGDFAVQYTVKFFIRDFAEIDPIQSGVLDRIWYAFRRENITIPFPIRDVRLRTEKEPDRPARPARARLDTIEFFATLPEEAKDRLADGMREEIYGTGEEIVRQGGEGRAFYLVAEGRVAVSATREGRDCVLARLGPGEFFGEMSLLTGEACSATVAAETDATLLALPHTALRPILQSNPALAERLAQALETRARTLCPASPAGTPSPATPPPRAEFTRRIRQFFGLGGAAS